MTLTRVLVFAGLTGTALMGGVCFAFGTAVMSALERMSPGQGATAMNLINVRIQNPLFLLLFVGTALVCLTLAVLVFVQDTSGKWWVLAGSLLYLVGMVVVSFAINIPLNDQLATLDPNSAAGAAEWQNYLARWTPANNLRAAACALGVIAFGLGLASGSASAAHAKNQPPVPTYQAAVFHGTPQR
ncbi:MAG TPA: anthrone oxygenase family protein [Kribbella sp.]|uniref:anthrone oxygenase family protein n=1 Tax=Kribbella sp. TaxID=1871183 RepID=UPI002D77FFA8|nr:anthrone oxygenase family protein [Kribbella sp.]HET6299283.1 anthrone oxygenase family protein [Kribbella sp.]